MSKNFPPILSILFFSLANSTPEPFISSAAQMPQTVQMQEMPAMPIRRSNNLPIKKLPKSLPGGLYNTQHKIKDALNQFARTLPLRDLAILETELPNIKGTLHAFKKIYNTRMFSDAMQKYCIKLTKTLEIEAQCMAIITSQEHYDYLNTGSVALAQIADTINYYLPDKIDELDDTILQLLKNKGAYEHTEAYIRDFWKTHGTAFALLIKNNYMHVILEQAAYFTELETNINKKTHISEEDTEDIQYFFSRIFTTIQQLNQPNLENFEKIEYLLILLTYCTHSSLSFDVLSGMSITALRYLPEFAKKQSLMADAARLVKQYDDSIEFSLPPSAMPSTTQSLSSSISSIPFAEE